MSTTPTLSSPGIGSGLDVSGIVSKLMAVESQPLTDLATQEASVQARISAYGSIKSALASFQSALKALSGPQLFGALSASVGDSDVLSATATRGAIAGSYAIEVQQLAQAQKIVSTGWAQTSDVVGSGTLIFEFGSFASTTFAPNTDAGARTVTIGAGQNTLAGIRDAVNAASIGVTATIVNDGSASGDRLVFTASSSGAANSLRVTAADADGNNVDVAGLSQLAYDPAATAGSGRNMTQKVAAQDALLSIDGIDITKSTNTISDAIEGVKLDLHAANIGSPTALTLTADTARAASAVQDLVKAYNDLGATLTNLSKYDAPNKRASVLTGDSTVRIIDSRVRGLLGNALSGINGVNGSFNTLSQIGISFHSDGTLALDTSKLSAAMTSNLNGVSSVFAAIAKADDALIGATASGDKLKPGSYAVNISQLATQGKIVGSAAAGLTITAGVNDQLVVSVDGTTTTISVPAGTYADASALASAVKSAINGASAMTQAGASVAVTQAAGLLTITSARYGAISSVAAIGSAASTVLGGSATATQGVDIAGTIGGVAATGSGQTLSGATGSALDGLSLQVTAGATGARGNVSYTKGFAAQLDSLVTQMLDADGIVSAGTDGMNKQIKDIDHRRDELQRRLTLVEANYRAQFTALDTLLGSMSATSTYLQQQLANLPKITSS